MRLFNRKSQLQRLVEVVKDSLDASGGITSGLPGVGSGKALKVDLPKGKTLKVGVPKDKVLKAGLVAGGLAGLTTGSAGISSLRRRREGARDDS